MKYFIMVFIILAPFAPLCAQIPTDSLIAYYPFNGDGNDSSGNGNNAIPSGGVTWSTDRFGNVGHAAYMDGLTGVMASNDTIRIGSNHPRTISCWISVDSFQCTSCLVGWGTVSPDPFYKLSFLKVQGPPDAYSRFIFHGAYTDLYSPSGSVTADRWYHVAFTYDGTTGFLYSNGVAVASGSLPLNTDQTRLSIGHDVLDPQTWCGWSSHFKGTIDDIRIYSRALSNAEIQMLYHEGGWSVGTRPDPPQNVSATPGNASATLHWQKNSVSDFLLYRIYSDTSSNPTTEVDSVSDVNTTSRTITGLTNGTTYHFRLTAVDSALRESDFSNEVTVTPSRGRPVAAALHDVYIPNAGRQLTSTQTFSSAGSYDPDGTIDSVHWYVNGSLVDTGSELQYNFGPGTSTVWLVVIDNSGAHDTSRAIVTRTAFQTYLNGPVYAGLSLLGDNILYAIATGDAIYRMDANGNVLYNLQVGGNVISASSIAYDTTVYIGSTDRNLYAFSKYGTPVWSALPLGAAISTTPTVDASSGRIYLGIGNKNFIAINRTTGNVAWNYFADAPITSAAIVTLDRKLVFASQKGTIYCFNIDSIPLPAAPLGTLNLADPISGSFALDLNNYLYVGSLNGKLYKISLGDGHTPSIVWSAQFGVSITASPVIDYYGNLYIGSHDRNFYCIDTGDGHIKWRFLTEGPIQSTGCVSNSGVIYCANDAGQVYALDTAGTVQWYYKDSSSIGAPLLYGNGMLYLGTEGNKVLAIYDNGGSHGPSVAALHYTASNESLTVPIWATFQGNNRRTGAVADNEVSTITTPSNVNFIGGWNMISIPVTISNSSKNILFPASISSAFEYEGSYLVKDTLRNGVGYWLKFYSAGGVVLNGVVRTTDAVAINPGWNMVGSISAPVSVASITSDSAGIVLSQFFGYNGSYSSIDTIQPGKGYWVKANKHCHILLSTHRGSATLGMNGITVVSTYEHPPLPPEGTTENSVLVHFPIGYSLDEAYPNPFNPTAVIRYRLPAESRVSLKVYNPLGQVVEILQDGIKAAGYKQVEWNASNIASGIYFYRLEATGVSDPSRTFTQVKKMILLR